MQTISPNSTKLENFPRPYLLVVGAVLTITSSVAQAPAPALEPVTLSQVGPKLADSKNMIPWLSKGVSEPESRFETQVDVLTLRAMSGLTTNQVARLFGVSRRSVHNWISGTPMSDHHQKRLVELLAVVEGIPNASTPDERRSALLATRGNSTVFHDLLDSLPAVERVVVSGATPREKLAL